MPQENDVSAVPLDSGGSFAYENWRAANHAAPRKDALEYPLFGDSRMVGEISFGPYAVINPIADKHSDVVLVLRCDTHAAWSFADMSSTDTTRYHGGTESDEIAALLSLALGCRLKAGDPTRWFQVGGDPRGRPWSFQSSGRHDPVIAGTSHHGVLIPQLVGERTLGDVEQLLGNFIHLPPASSVALVRSARLYQDGVWLSESDPALAWLLLVSAIEVAANHWRSSDDSDRERLRASKPELELLLTAQAGGEELADHVATMIAKSLGATSKFIGFCMAFLPAPPEPRPGPPNASLPWHSASKMKEALSTVYRYRSEALHAGTPFPAPMCSVAYRGNEYAERPPYGAMGAYGGIWRNEDIPMFLHTFEYIARNVLLGWWGGLAEARTADVEGHSAAV
jgi:hypothetical protein